MPFIFAVSFNTLLEILFKLTAYRYNAFVVKTKTKNCFDKRDMTKNSVPTKKQQYIREAFNRKKKIEGFINYAKRFN